MSKLKSILKRTPGVYPAYLSLKRWNHAARSLSSPYVRMFPAGHFYSPLPDVKDVAARRETLFNRNVTVCAGVDLRPEHQLDVLAELAQYYGEVPFPEEPSSNGRYYFNNRFFRHGDAIVLYAMLRRLRPRRVIEVGSGFSSAVMLDTNEKFLGGAIEFTFIDPYPNRLLTLLSETDRRRHRVVQQRVQDVAVEEFTLLAANDVLFIDSSHVVKVGSDVRHILWEVLPQLQTGVVIHFHDVMWPFEYPQEWVLAGNAWNEAYFLRTFLQYNDTFQIEYFNSYIGYIHAEVLRQRMPVKTPGAGLWLRKVK